MTRVSDTRVFLSAEALEVPHGIAVARTDYPYKYIMSLSKENEYRTQRFLSAPIMLTSDSHLEANIIKK